MRRNLSLAFLLFALIPSSAFAASAAAPPAKESATWTEYHRAYAETRAYRVLRTEPGGAKEVVLRTACLRDLEETWSCEAVLEIYRKLSVLAMPRQVTFNLKPPGGGERPAPAERLGGYAVDCAGGRYAPLSIEWRAADGSRITRIEYPERGWRPLERLEKLPAQVCR
ncbi:MAG: hypothetical protein HYZ11_09490 [Candidatus Tectomicrobia bacterium]|uniref:Lipoprotein n=1 Tax=Tectimicrobiota bacterium TaxID=2528274 RepID=A0A932MM27_UNCTE|nr:hypothetical protein [Candidatus Tectomicrobia bacterium]